MGDPEAEASLTHAAVLQAAVADLHGSARPGQQAMAAAVAESITTGRHLLVQAGTGTGKSLGYLAPTLAALAEAKIGRAVIATATLALQAQLAHCDVPAALDAVAAVTGRRPVAAVLKGRSNYACLHRVRAGSPDPPPQDALFTAAELGAPEAPQPSASGVGQEVLQLREWAETQLRQGGVADRDDAPPHSDSAWVQVSVPVRECLGVARCPFGEECLVEKSRELARRADLVITNHTLLAINALSSGGALPGHEVVIVDEAHEFADRVTRAASAELSPQLLDRVARRAVTWLDDDLGKRFLAVKEVLQAALESAPLQRISEPESAVVAAAELIRGVSREVISKLGEESLDAERTQAEAAVREVFEVAERVVALAAAEVVYVGERERFGRELRVAPMSVADLVRQEVFAKQTVVLTSATLRVGGDFTPVAQTLGLTVSEGAESAFASDSETMPPEQGAPKAGLSAVEQQQNWRGVDVGSPFDYPQQAILYLAAALPPPSRTGISEQALAALVELIRAADGGALGLFASRRNAAAAASYVRSELSVPVLCQGDSQLPELTRQFIADPRACLFGTLSLWQGVDVPGSTCRLVIMDKIPFPQPDDPLVVARQQAVAAAGGNGFLQVSAAHAALLLAQGAGRLIRTTSDRGVVAVLDPRLVTAKYGRFLRDSLPGMWTTTSAAVALEALRRLASLGATSHS